MNRIIEIPEYYPYTECEVCGEEIHNSQLQHIGNRYVCSRCFAEFIGTQEDSDDDNDYYEED
jgi:formylmethanofuran dehydrogenase subunit E